jgi:iron complex outermembrane receptor protein
VFEPMSNLSFTVDYWNIEVKNLITGVTDTSAVEEAYYTNNGVVNIPGYTVSPGAPDPAFPNALPVLGFIQTSYANQDKQNVSGVDFGANLSLPIGDTVTWRSSLDVSFLQKFELTTDAGVKARYDGTLSPCNVTSCSGAPEVSRLLAEHGVVRQHLDLADRVLHERLRHGVGRLRRC